MNLSSLLSKSVMPPGAVMPFAANSAPAGWLTANGAAISRTTYSALFAVIGGTYGVGDGSTTFNLPDLRGYFVRGSGTNSDGVASGTFGARQADAYKSHNHGGLTTAGNTGGESADHAHYVSGTTGGESADHAHYVSGTTSSNGSHTHTQLGGGSHDDGGPNVTGSVTSGTLSNIAANGAHTHTFAAWSGGRNTAHTHSFAGWTGGRNTAHTHSVQLGINFEGSGETRPRNIPMLYCIKF
jgi:microcystin-dependent protein